MLSERPSVTAEAVCFFRALERRRPADDRALDDAYAEAMLSPIWRRLLDGGWRAHVAKVASIGGARSLDALVSFVVARHRFMDDRLVDALEAGVEQVVILGAGYDTRAQRFVRQLGGRLVFEVDHPATQRAKRARLDAGTTPLPQDHVRWVPVDFARDDFAAALRAAGFREGARTFFIWEGVTMYLREDAVRETLRAARALSGPFSELTADLWASPSGAGWGALATRWGARLLGLVGEPVTWSLAPDVAGAFFEGEGYELLRLGRPADLERWYELAPRRVFDAVYVAHARARPA